MSGSTILIALGGNALLQRGQKGTFEEQYKNVGVATRSVADLVETGHKVVLTHGNGPQVGATLLRHEAAKASVPPFPLYACGAETQGFIGYMLQQSLGNELRSRGIKKDVVTIVTRTLVSRDDRAFLNPTKPIGPFYTKEQAKEMEVLRPDIVLREDSGRGYRRIVPSPDPKEIVEKGAVRTLIDAGFIVIAGGGGGIPTVEDEKGDETGVQAVIDKDLGAQRLATLIGAGLFLIITDVPGAYLNFGKPEQELITDIAPDKLQRYFDEGHFGAGSMATKVLAGIRFVQAGGERATIAHLDKLVEASKGTTGTNVRSGSDRA